MNKIHLSKRPGHAFRLGVDILRELCTTIENETNKKPQVRVRNPDGDWTFDGIEELLSYSRASERRIHRLEIWSNTLEDLSLNVDFDAHWVTSHPLSVSVGGRHEEKVENTRERLLSVIRKTRPWYSPLSRYVYTVHNILLALLLLTSFVVLLLRVQGRNFTGSPMAVYSVIGIGVMANIARPVLFPRGRFHLWRGLARREAFKELVHKPPTFLRLLHLLSPILVPILTAIASCFF